MNWYNGLNWGGDFMNRLGKKAAAAAVLAVSLVTVPAAASAASAAESLIYGAAAMVYVSQYVSRLDDQGQRQFLSQAQKETGVYQSQAAADRLDAVYRRLKSSGDIKRDYEIYAAPGEDVNAFMSLGGVMCVYKGALDVLDDGELAYVMGHELAHGEKRHSVSGLKKQIGLSTAVSVYTAANPTVGAAILSNVAGNYINNAVFTKDQEKEADQIGFTYLTDAGYNPGAAAAAMQVLYEKYGDNTPSGIQAVVQPGNHPATSDRIEKNVKRMYEYSGKQVNVRDGYIVVRGVKTFAPAASGKYSAPERTYLTAGKLARLYHDGTAGTAVFDGQDVLCGQTAVYRPGSGENGAAIAAALNKGIQKN